MYLWDALDGSTTFVKDPDVFTRNALLGDYSTLWCGHVSDHDAPVCVPTAAFAFDSGCSTIDNDDGSSYFSAHHNFMVRLASCSCACILLTLHPPFNRSTAVRAAPFAHMRLVLSGASAHSLLAHLLPAPCTPHAGCAAKNDFEGHDGIHHDNVYAYMGMGLDNGYGGQVRLLLGGRVHVVVVDKWASTMVTNSRAAPPCRSALQARVSWTATRTTSTATPSSSTRWGGMGQQPAVVPRQPPD